MEIFHSISHAMEGAGGIFQATFSQTKNVTDMKLGSHNVYHVKNVL